MSRTHTPKDHPPLVYAMMESIAKTFFHGNRAAAWNEFDQMLAQDPSQPQSKPKRKARLHLRNVHKAGQ